MLAFSKLEEHLDNCILTVAELSGKSREAFTPVSVLSSSAGSMQTLVNLLAVHLTLFVLT